MLVSRHEMKQSIAGCPKLVDICHSLYVIVVNLMRLVNVSSTILWHYAPLERHICMIIYGERNV